MLHFRSCLLIFLSGLLFLSVYTAAQADDMNTNTVVVEKKVIVTPAPAATCTSVAGHWEGNTWVYSHNVCKYENRTEGSIWIDSYWSCTAASDTTCTAWTLVPGHWSASTP